MPSCRSLFRPRAASGGVRLLAFALSASSGYACYSSTAPDSSGDGAGDASTEMDGASSVRDAAADAPVRTGEAGSGGEQTSDLPCAIAALLATRCQSCHGSRPTNGAPMSLVTHADLAAPSPSKPSITVAASAVARIGATDGSIMPPPPAAALARADITTFDDWVSAGFPASGCFTSPDDGGFGEAGAADSGSDAGTSDAGPPAIVCTSGKTWTEGDHGSAVMHPGGACIACHSVDNGPTFAVAGTVFPTLHEPDDCDGANLSGLAVVDIVDSKGVETKIPVDTVGNFHAYADQVSITPPFRAALVEGATMRAMTEHQTVGDCNSCHTTLGTNGAPGRIMAP